MFRKAAKLEKEILKNEEKAKEYEEFADTVDQIVEANAETNKRRYEERKRIGYHDW